MARNPNGLRAHSGQPFITMSREQNKSVARRFFEAFEANDQATLKELLAPDFVAYLPGAYEQMNRQEFLRNVIGAGNFRENWREKCQKLS